MTKREIIQQITDFVKKTLSNAEGSHDWWHVYRVWKMAKRIGRKESADMLIVELAALLHDIADWKFQTDKENDGSKTARLFMEKLHIEEDIISHVCQIINDLDFKGAGTITIMESIEGKIVHDADKLDAIGAIGIARTFIYSGFIKRQIYNPEIKPIYHKTFKEYKHNNSSTINHFHEKLLLLKDRMNTKTGKLIAQDRHKFMKIYLDQFHKEWEGKV